MIKHKHMGKATLPKGSATHNLHQTLMASRTRRAWHQTKNESPTRPFEENAKEQARGLRLRGWLPSPTDPCVIARAGETAFVDGRVWRAMGGGR